MKNNLLGHYEADLLAADSDDSRWDVLSAAIIDSDIEIEEFGLLAVRAGALMDDIKSGRGVVGDLVRMLSKTVLQKQHKQQKRRLFG